MNNEVQVRCGARKDREQYRSSVPDDLQGLRHRAEIGRKAALVRSSGVPSWLAPTKIRVSKMESRFAASLNGLLQQNRALNGRLRPFRLTSALLGKAEVGVGKIDF